MQLNTSSPGLPRLPSPTDQKYAIRVTWPVSHFTHQFWIPSPQDLAILSPVTLLLSSTLFRPNWEVYEFSLASGMAVSRSSQSVSSLGFGYRLLTSFKSSHAFVFL